MDRIGKNYYITISVVIWLEEMLLICIEEYSIMLFVQTISMIQTISIVYAIGGASTKFGVRRGVA